MEPQSQAADADLVLGSDGYPVRQRRAVHGDLPVDRLHEEGPLLYRDRRVAFGEPLVPAGQREPEAVGDRGALVAAQHRARPLEGEAPPRDVARDDLDAAEVLVVGREERDELRGPREPLDENTEDGEGDVGYLLDEEAYGLVLQEEELHRAAGDARRRARAGPQDRHLAHELAQPEHRDDRVAAADLDLAREQDEDLAAGLAFDEERLAPSELDLAAALRHRLPRGLVQPAEDAPRERLRLLFDA